MNESEQIELAKAYVALSNAHCVEFILPLFTKSTHYHSTYVGELEGKDVIGAMMADYFLRFPDVYWNVPEYRYIKNGIVNFEFALTATEAQTGDRVERIGFEQIEFSYIGRFRIISAIC
jgi:hypothetical protein